MNQHVIKASDIDRLWAEWKKSPDGLAFAKMLDERIQGMLNPLVDEMLKRLDAEVQRAPKPSGGCE